jgi:hypothetical protein
MKNSLLIKFYVVILMALGLNAMENGSYKIKSLYSGKCLEIETLENNSKLIQSKCIDRETQKFTITNVEKNIYTISNIAAENKSGDNGIQFFSSLNPEEFILTEFNNNTFWIRSRSSKKFLTLIPYSDVVIQSNGNGNKEQFWKIVKE